MVLLQEEQAVGTGMDLLGMALCPNGRGGDSDNPLMPERNEASLILLLHLCFSIKSQWVSCFSQHKRVNIHKETSGHSSCNLNS